MLARISAAPLAFILAGMIPLHGQDQFSSVGAAGSIATDRPAVTNSSVVVPDGSLQAENGFLETSSQGQSVLAGPESLVRFGVAKRTELRFTVPDHFHNLTTSGGSGFGDFAFGVKEQLGPTPGGFDVSVILFLGFPTGANAVSSGDYDPGLQVPWSRAIRQLDGCRNVIGVLGHSGPHAKCDRRVHVPVRSAVDKTMGCLCRVRR
jgi:hypothetical protein